MMAVLALADRAVVVDSNNSASFTLAHNALH